MPAPTSYSTPWPIDLEVRNAAGLVEVTATDATTSVVEVVAIGDSQESIDLAERARVEPAADGRRLVVVVPDRRNLFGRGGPVAVRVTVPTGSKALIRTAVAKTVLRGRLGRAEVHTSAGPVEVAEVAGPVEVRAASGAVVLGAVGTAQVRTASGAVTVDHATGGVEIHCASGQVRVGTAEASVRVHTASGDITVGEASHGAVELSAASGDLRIGVRPGAVARLDLFSRSGRVRSDLPVDDVPPDGGAAVEIRARTGSGDVLVATATASRTG